MGWTVGRIARGSPGGVRGGDSKLGCRQSAVNACRQCTFCESVALFGCRQSLPSKGFGKVPSDPPWEPPQEPPRTAAPPQGDPPPDPRPLCRPSVCFSVWSPCLSVLSCFVLCTGLFFVVVCCLCSVWWSAPSQGAREKPGPIELDSKTVKSMVFRKCPILGGRHELTT